MSKKRKNQAREMLDQQLTTYAGMAATTPVRKDNKAWLVFGAASAALVVGSAAEASVMYSGPMNIMIGGTNSFGSTSIDLDNYGGPDFRFEASNTDNFGGGTSSFGTARGTGLGPSNLIGSTEGFANNYVQSSFVGPRVETEGTKGTEGFNQSTKGVSFGTNVNFLGVQFAGAGGIQSGWIQVDVKKGPLNGARAGLEIVQWAWESDADTAIHVSVPEPEMTWLLGLGLLAMGATGIRRMRRRREAEAQG